MSKFVGRLGELGLAKEAVRGTALAPTIWLGRNTISFDDKTTTARNTQAVGRIEDSDGNHVVGKHGEGEFEMDMEDVALGLVLTSLFGASPVTTGSNPYTHTYTLSNANTHQSLSLTYQDPDSRTVYPLCVVNSVSITIEPDAIVKMTVGFMSRVGKDWTRSSAVYTSLGNKFLHQFANVKLADTIAALSGASNISVKNLELNIVANTFLDNVIGTVAPQDILNQQFTVEGSLTLNKEDSTYRDYMLNGTYKALEINLTRATNSALTLQMPRVDFTEWEQDRTLDTIVTQSINFKGNYDAANGLAVISTCTLVNANTGSNY